jgi:hypothetical protein
MSGKLATCSLTALAGAAILALSAGPVSAFTLASPSLERPIASVQIEKAYYYRHGWRGGYGWHGGYGWRGPGWRGPGYGHCWRGYYGHLHCN